MSTENSEYAAEREAAPFFVTRRGTCDAANVAIHLPAEGATKDDIEVKCHYQNRSSITWKWHPTAAIPDAWLDDRGCAFCFGDAESPTPSSGDAAYGRTPADVLEEAGFDDLSDDADAKDVASERIADGGHDPDLTYHNNWQLRQEIAYAVGCDPSRYDRDTDPELNRDAVVAVATTLQPTDSEFDIEAANMRSLNTRVCEWVGDEPSGCGWVFRRETLKKIHRAVGGRSPDENPIDDSDQREVRCDGGRAADRRGFDAGMIGQEVLLVVRETGNGAKVTEYDGDCVTDTVTKRIRRLFSDSTGGRPAVHEALAFAHDQRKSFVDRRDCRVTVVGPDERVHEALQEQAAIDDVCDSDHERATLWLCVRRDRSIGEAIRETGVSHEVAERLLDRYETRIGGDDQ